MISKAYLGQGVYKPVSQMSSAARRTLARKIKGGRLAQEGAATARFNADARKYMNRTNRQLMRDAKPIAAPAGMDKTRKGVQVNWFESKNLSRQGVGGFQLNTGGRRAPRNIVVNSKFNQAAARRKPDPAVRTEMANVRRHEFQHAQPNVSSWRVMQQSGMDTPKKFHRRKDGVVNRPPSLSREEARASYMAGDRYSAKTARGRGVYLTASRNQSDPGSRALRAQMRGMERKGVRSSTVSPDVSDRSLGLLDRFERADVKARRNAAMRARRKVTKSMGIEEEIPQAEGSKEPVYTRARDESGRFIGTLHMGNSLPTSMVEGRREVSKALFKPKLPKPPTVPKPKVPKNVLGAPKPAAVPQTKGISAPSPRIRETGVSKAGHPDWHGWGKTRVPTTRKERAAERAKNAGGAAAFSAGTSGAITYGLNLRNPGRGRAVLGAAGIGAGLGALVGGAHKPRQTKLVQKSFERGELVARQIPKDKQLRSTRVRKMSPDPSELHVMGAPQAASARRAAAQRAARTRKLRYLTPTRMNQASGR